MTGPIFHPSSSERPFDRDNRAEIVRTRNANYPRGSFPAPEEDPSLWIFLRPCRLLIGAVDLINGEKDALSGAVIL